MTGRGPAAAAGDPASPTDPAPGAARPAPDRAGERLRLGYVPGATPGKWARVWAERHPRVPLDLVPVPAADAVRALRAGDVDAAILRPSAERDGLAVVPLYEERTVVVVARDHLLAALEATEEVTAADLADEIVLRPADDVVRWSEPDGVENGAAEPEGDRLPGRPAAQTPATTLDAIQLVAAGVGVTIVPQSLARLHHRRDVTHRPLRDGPVAPVALAWVVSRADERIEDLFGIVRGRTANSSRGARRDVHSSEESDARVKGSRHAGRGTRHMVNRSRRRRRRG